MSNGDIGVGLSDVCCGERVKGWTYGGWWWDVCVSVSVVAVVGSGIARSHRIEISYCKFHSFEPYIYFANFILHS